MYMGGVERDSRAPCLSHSKREMRCSSKMATSPSRISVVSGIDAITPDNFSKSPCVIPTLRRRESAHDGGDCFAPGPRLEHKRLGLLQVGTKQRRDGEPMRHEHE